MTDVLRCWGKTVKGSDTFHPALFHMLDVGHVARELLSAAASSRWRNVLAGTLGMDPERLVDWLPCLVALHDIGKISAAFQGCNETQKMRLETEGFPFGEWRQDLDVHHSTIGQVSVAAELPSLSRGVAMPDSWWRIWREVVGGHHGRFASRESFKKAQGEMKTYEPPEWADMRATTARMIETCFRMQTPFVWPEPANTSAAIMAIAGFTILCDWLGSDSTYFAARTDLPVEEYAAWSAAHAKWVVEAAGLLQRSKSDAPTSFAMLFPDKKEPRPLQQAIDDIPAALLAKPCLAIIEAPTGEGKTEAALALAHRLAQAGDTDELYYALPTTATSNQMFGRLQHHLRDRLGLSTRVKLVHGQAFLVEDDLRVEPLENGDSTDQAASLEWFGPKKRALLAPFGVGTIDQAELAALNVRHVALRLAGLAGKVVILDEVHAYDMYMTTIIERLLEWLATLGSSVILLSATLPLARKAALARAYGVTDDPAPERKSAYPNLWVASHVGSHCVSPPPCQLKKHLQLGALHLAEEETEAKARWLLAAVAEGGCACWITNTVKRAQSVFKVLDDLAPAEVDRSLLHSRFPLEDRQDAEKQLTAKYGPPTESRRRPVRGVVIGTQVLEQSLDLDFDVMISDLAPVDLLLQRAGRLHRHARDRPATHSIPRLWINTELAGDGNPELRVDHFIYAEYTLLQTWLALHERQEIVLPADYRPLIEAVYGSADPAPDSPLADAWKRFEKKEARALGEAKLRLLPTPDPEWPYFGADAGLQFEESETRAGWIVAQTRLSEEGEENLNVIPLERCGDEVLLPTGERFNLREPAPRDAQLRLLRRSLRLGDRRLVRALTESGEKLPRLFRDSALLKDYAPLWLSGGTASLRSPKGIIQVILDPRLGLVIAREGD